jgi:GAF domain-containing protein/HAMP domain-containing protein
MMLSKLDWRNWPLAAKLTLSTTILIVLVVAGITWLSIRREQQTFRAELQQQAELLLNTLVNTVSDPLYYLDVDWLSATTAGLGEDRGLVTSGRIYDKEGRVIADAYDAELMFRYDVDPFGKRLVESETIIFEWRPDELVAGRAVTAGHQRLGAVSVGLPTAPLEDKLAAVRNQSLIVALVAVVAGTLVAQLFSRAITRPLTELMEVTRAAAGGDLARQVAIPKGYEFAKLAGAFNSMVTQLGQTLEGLEERVTKRTQALETSAQVSRRLSTILDQKQLVAEVVSQVQQAFDYYHTHIYLADEASGDLIMAGGTGEAGRAMLAAGHRLLHGKGLVGRAATSQAAVLVPDVSQAEGWLPNPLLPETRAEVAVPIMAGERVLGVLDVQHNVVGGLGQSDADLLGSIAGQVAVALQNTRLFAETRQRAEYEARINLINQNIQRATNLESMLQIAARELGGALGAQRVAVQLAPSADGDPLRK